MNIDKEIAELHKIIKNKKNNEDEYEINCFFCQSGVENPSVIDNLKMKFKKTNDVVTVSYDGAYNYQIVDTIKEGTGFYVLVYKNDNIYTEINSNYYLNRNDETLYYMYTRYNACFIIDNKVTGILPDNLLPEQYTQFTINIDLNIFFDYDSKKINYIFKTTGTLIIAPTEKTNMFIKLESDVLDIINYAISEFSTSKIGLYISIQPFTISYIADFKKRIDTVAEYESLLTRNQIN